MPLFQPKLNELDIDTSIPVNYRIRTTGLVDEGGMMLATVGQSTSSSLRTEEIYECCFFGSKITLKFKRHDMYYNVHMSY